MLSQQADLFQFTPGPDAVDPANTPPGSGILFLSRNVFPKANTIVWHSPLLANPFVVTALKDYLNFLEMVILNEQLIVGVQRNVDVGELILQSPLCKKYVLENRRWVWGGDLHIEQALRNELQALGILREVEVRGPRLSPIGFVEQRLEQDADLQKEFEDLRNRFAKEETDETIVKGVALMIMTMDHGELLYLADAFGRAPSPYVLEVERISGVVSLEADHQRVRKHVIGYLKQQLDVGARSEAKRVEELGSSTVFPETPIAMQVVMNAKSPEDLLDVALQLRDQYKSFRRAMGQIERDLFDENMTLAKRRKLVSDLEALGGTLWGGEPGDIHRATKEMTGLLDLAEPFSFGHIQKIIRLILGSPLDLVLRALRKRKIRILHEAKRAFLQSRACEQKLAGIFNLPLSLVREAVSVGKPILNDAETMAAQVISRMRDDKSKGPSEREPHGSSGGVDTKCLSDAAPCDETEQNVKIEKLDWMVGDLNTHPDMWSMIHVKSIMVLDYVDGLPLADNARVRNSFADGCTHMGRREFESAIDEFVTCLTLEQDPKKRGVLNLQIGQCYLSLNRPSKATEFFDIAVNESREANDPKGVATAMASLGTTYLMTEDATRLSKRADWEKVWNLYDQAITIFMDIKAYPEATRTLFAWGFFCIVGFDVVPESSTYPIEVGRVKLEQAFKVFKIHNLQRETAWTELLLAIACIKLAVRKPAQRAAHIEAAIEYLTSASNVLIVDDDKFGYREAQMLLGLSHLIVSMVHVQPEHKCEASRKAVEYFTSSLEFYTMDNESRTYATIQKHMLRAYENLGKHEEQQESMNIRKAEKWKNRDEQ